MKNLLILLILGFYNYSYSQIVIKDTVITNELNEVIVVGTKTPLHEKQIKTLASVDEFLQKSIKVDLIKRGAYAWEPLLNGMATERTVVTIDGMRIFGACTDKMDPVTSYVEVSNLSEATVSSGQQGSCHGSTIGGSIDLKLSNKNNMPLGWDFTLLTGYESNNQQKLIGGGINFRTKPFYVTTDVMFRDAENYKAGNAIEISFSQFRKINFSTTAGYRLTQNKTLEASLIFDRATNVGYPALTMDVSLAQALITSVNFEYSPMGRKMQYWETKMYYNTIRHTMDDTKRPFVPIHMDMPGWSDTYGFYSTLKTNWNKHQFTANANGYYNRSVAEMTMYPSDPNENLMFMYTWPDVRTWYSGYYLEDNWKITSYSSLKMTTTLGIHSNFIASDFGLENLQIFYTDLKTTQSRFLKSFSTNYAFEKGKFLSGTGLAFGERAPSVSEGYGVYLYNSFDNYDYIGNPYLKNEQSYEANLYFGITHKKWSTKLTSSYFHIKNYIIGMPDVTMSSMTIGARGIKRYAALDYATIWSNDLVLGYTIAANWLWNGKLQYYLGKDMDGNSLPFMSPLAYTSSILFYKNQWSGSLSITGNAVQRNYNSYYGEDKTPSYAILNGSISRKLNWNTTKIQFNLGMENMLDTYYSTYTDWKNIPRMGRNFFINISFS